MPPLKTVATGTVNVGNMGVPHVFAARTHGAIPDAAIQLDHIVHPNVFVIEYVYLFVTSKPGDDVQLAIRDEDYLVESVGLFFEATPVKGGFMVEKLVKIPIGKALHATILRSNLTAPDPNNPMTYKLVISGSLQVPQP